MRPAVLRQDRKTSTKTASVIAKLLIRNFSSEHLVGLPEPQEALLIS
jgi:hypothetical protein